jgi:hypothetical protein
LLGIATAGGAAGEDLYWGDKLVCDADSANCGWATPGEVVAANYWNITAGTIQTKNTTLDLLIGGTSTASAAVALDATTGNVRLTGDLFIGGTSLSYNEATASGASLVGLFDDGMNYVSANTDVQDAIKQLDTAINSVSGGAVGGTGTENYVAYWSGTSTLAAEQYLSPSRGGTGLSGATAPTGSLLLGTGTGYSLGFLTGSGDISIASGSGTIAFTLTDTIGAGAGTYGGATQIPQITVDAKGRITNISNQAISYDNYGSWTVGDGSATRSITTGTQVNITGGTGYNFNALRCNHHHTALTLPLMQQNSPPSPGETVLPPPLPGHLIQAGLQMQHLPLQTMP